MWDNPQQLRQLYGALFGISLVLILYGVVHYAVHLPVFALRTMQLEAAPQRVEASRIEAVARTELRGNFFTVDLEHVRAAFEQLPWVRKVSVRRQFPWRLEVSMEEQVALAQWNGKELVNTYGEVFAAEIGESEKALPKFFGQRENSAEVTRMYAEFGKQLAPLKQQVTQISLSPRRAWQLKLDNGMVLELGREQAQERLARFVAVYPYSLGSMQRKINYVDLRYRNGFAAYFPGGAVAVKGKT